MKEIIHFSAALCRFLESTGRQDLCRLIAEFTYLYIGKERFEEIEREIVHTMNDQGGDNG